MEQGHSVMASYFDLDLKDFNVFDFFRKRVSKFRSNLRKTFNTCMNFVNIYLHLPTSIYIYLHLPTSTYFCTEVIHSLTAFTPITSFTLFTPITPITQFTAARDLPYRAKLCRAKVKNFWKSDENFDGRKFRPTKLRQTR